MGKGSKWAAVLGLGMAAMSFNGRAEAGEVRVMVSGAFTGAFRSLVPRFERDSGHKLLLSWGPSFGTTGHALPVRLEAGEPADVVLMVDTSLDRVVGRGAFSPADRVPIARSLIRVGVKAGAARPDIRSVEAVRDALLAAGTIGYSEGASGVFVATGLLDKLGIRDQVAARMRKVTGELVGDAIARGEVELGIQQVSELRSVANVDFVGAMPPELQAPSMMVASVSTRSQDAAAARAFVAFLLTPDARGALADSGLEPAARPETR